MNRERLDQEVSSPNEMNMVYIGLREKEGTHIFKNPTQPAPPLPFMVATQNIIWQQSKYFSHSQMLNYLLVKMIASNYWSVRRELYHYTSTFQLSNYSYWKARLMIYLHLQIINMEQYLMDHMFLQTLFQVKLLKYSSRNWEEKDKLKCSLGVNAMNILYCGLNAGNFRNINAHQC